MTSVTISPEYQALSQARQIIIRAENEAWKDNPQGSVWQLVCHAKYHLEHQMLKELKGDLNATSPTS